MSTREIAAEARIIIAQEGYDKAKELLQDYIIVANAKIKAFSDELNKEYRIKRSAPKIRVITDFYRFK